MDNIIKCIAIYIILCLYIVKQYYSFHHFRRFALIIFCFIRFSDSSGFIHFNTLNYFSMKVSFSFHNFITYLLKRLLKNDGMSNISSGLSMTTLLVIKHMKNPEKPFSHKHFNFYKSQNEHIKQFFFSYIVPVLNLWQILTTVQLKIDQV